MRMRIYNASAIRVDVGFCTSYAACSSPWSHYWGWARRHEVHTHPCKVCFALIFCCGVFDVIVGLCNSLELSHGLEPRVVLCWFRVYVVRRGDIPGIGCRSLIGAGYGGSWLREFLWCVGRGFETGDVYCHAPFLVKWPAYGIWWDLVFSLF